MYLPGFDSFIPVPRYCNPSWYKQITHLVAKCILILNEYFIFYSNSFDKKNVSTFKRYCLSVPRKYGCH